LAILVRIELLTWPATLQFRTRASHLGAHPTTRGAILAADPAESGAGTASEAELLLVDSGLMHVPLPALLA
jgi:hypothetical protein